MTEKNYIDICLRKKTSLSECVQFVAERNYSDLNECTEILRVL